MELSGGNGSKWSILHMYLKVCLFVGEDSSEMKITSKMPLMTPECTRMTQRSNKVLRYKEALQQTICTNLQ